MVIISSEYLPSVRSGCGESLSRTRMGMRLVDALLKDSASRSRDPEGCEYTSGRKECGGQVLLRTIRPFRSARLGGAVGLVINGLE